MSELEKLRKENCYLQMKVDILKKDTILSDDGIRNRRISKIIKSLRDKYKLKDLLEYFNFPKSSYMYWQERLDKTNKDDEIEEKIKEVRKDNPNYGYRRITAMLRKQGLLINKKKVQRLIQKLKLQVTSFSRKTRKYSSYKGQIGKVADNIVKRQFTATKPNQLWLTDVKEFRIKGQEKNFIYHQY